MNLIEKVAKAITNNSRERGYMVHRLYINHVAQAAISAMPSIKWQKIETLPEELEEGHKILAWDGRGIILYWNCIYKEFFNEGGVGWKLNELTHWAEINAPEDE